MKPTLAIVSNVKRVTPPFLIPMAQYSVMLQETGQLALSASSTFVITAPTPSQMVNWISQLILVNMEFISRQLAILATTP